MSSEFERPEAVVTSSPFVVGHGPTRILALHGWFGDAHGWGSFPGLVNLDKHTWAFVDYRGYGARKDVAGEHTNAEIAADVLAVADELGWDDFVVVGHSMGGKAAQRLLVAAPDRVSMIVGISPIHADPFPWTDESWALFAGAAQNDDNRYAIIDFTTGNRNSASWINAMVAYSVAASTREAFADYLQAWGREDFLADVPVDTAPPIHVVVGSHDQGVGEEYVRGSWLRTYPHATLEVLANAGHYAMWETPVALLTSIEDAVASIPAA